MADVAQVVAGAGRLDPVPFGRRSLGSAQPTGSDAYGTLLLHAR